MKGLLVFVLLVAGAVHAAPAQSPFLGANFNESLEWVDGDDLKRSHSQWARGFIVYHHYKNGQRSLSSDPRIEGFKRLKAEGMNTILSLKFNFQQRPFPQTAAQIDEELSLLPDLLDALMPYADIVVAGNEPFIETDKSLRKAPLGAFYREVATRIHNYQQKHGFAQPLYLGAFNRLWEPRMKDDSAPLLALAKSLPWVAGIDLHIHHNTQEQFVTMIDFALANIRDDQRFIATEFSLMHHWKAAVQQTLPKKFAEQYGYPQNMKAYAYLDKVLNDAPVSRAEWVAFLRQSDWFESRKHYIRDAMQTFRQYPQFYGATYGLYQAYGNKPFTEDSTPWILNSLFSNQTVTKQSGKPAFHYQFMRDYIAEQEQK